MREITPDNLKTKVETLSREYAFPIHNLFAAKDDYSLPEVEELGLWRRDEILIGCLFSDEPESRRVSLEYRLFKGEFNSFIATIGGIFFREYPGAKQIIERNLSKVGIRLQPNQGMIVAQLDPPSMDTVETFLSAYFQAQKQADKYVSELLRMRKELNSQYSMH